MSNLAAPYSTLSRSIMFKSAIALVAGITLSAIAPEIAAAATFDPKPLYQNFGSHSTTNAFNGNATDLYYPTWEDASVVDDLPIALLLQGARVDKSFYSDYASQVARYGFVVVVPNNLRTIPGIGLTPLSDTSQLQATLDQLDLEATDLTSRLNGKVDTGKLGLLGHSFGGAVGLSAISKTCLPLLCPKPFERPEELVAGAFFGTNLRDQNDVSLPIDNEGIGVALIQGDLDGTALPFRAELTYEQIQSPPKALITLGGVNHFGITNVTAPEGTVPDPIAQTVEQAAAIETTARWSSLFLRGTMYDDSAALDYVLNTGADLDPLVTNVETEAQSVPEPTAWAGSLGMIVGLLWLKRRRQSAVGSSAAKLY